MRNLLPIIAVTLLALTSPAALAESIDDLREQVRETEVAFAKSMADRDHDAFASFLADETIFLSGRTVLRGRDAVAQAWKGYFDTPDAPFSWAPETVEVLDSGTLAISTGPVFAPDGSRIGTFNSTWRRETDGHWKIVLDNGCPPCRCGSK